MNRNKIFMIVDDDSDDCEFFCQGIEEIDPNSECIFAVNGKEALTKLRSETAHLPDFIFLDLNMPRMDGRTCLTELKKDEALKNIPVIIFSTSVHPAEKEELRKQGAAHFFSKPSDFEELKREIQFVIDMAGTPMYE
jgi:CheY-like chemotaxis protein